MTSLERLGKNIGGYHGEPIDIQNVLWEIEQLMAAKNWVRDIIPLSLDGIAPPVNFLAYRRMTEPARNRIYLSTGIHGDEPAGPLAVWQLLREDRWPADAAIWLCPCLNLTGFPLNRRENFRGVDLNRDYRHLESEEVRAHVKWLGEQPQFDISLCLHEDWESHGFYIYELNPDERPSFATKMIEAVSKICPIDLSAEIEGRPAEQGIIHPQLIPAERPQWPEALYLITQKTRLSYTLEAPSDFPLATRVKALVTAVRIVLDSL